jgi:hypothetical protein
MLHGAGSKVVSHTNFGASDSSICLHVVDRMRERADIAAFLSSTVEEILFISASNSGLLQQVHRPESYPRHRSGMWSMIYVHVHVHLQ